MSGLHAQMTVTLPMETVMAIQNGPAVQDLLEAFRCDRPGPCLTVHEICQAVVEALESTPFRVVSAAASNKTTSLPPTPDSHEVPRSPFVDSASQYIEPATSRDKREKPSLGPETRSYEPSSPSVDSADQHIVLATPRTKPRPAAFERARPIYEPASPTDEPTSLTLPPVGRTCAPCPMLRPILRPYGRVCLGSRTIRVTIRDTKLNDMSFNVFLTDSFSGITERYAQSIGGSSARLVFSIEVGNILRHFWRDFEHVEGAGDVFGAVYGNWSEVGSLSPRSTFRDLGIIDDTVVFLEPQTTMTVTIRDTMHDEQKFELSHTVTLSSLVDGYAERVGQARDTMEFFGKYGQELREADMGSYLQILGIGDGSVLTVGPPAFQDVTITFRDAMGRKEHILCSNTASVEDLAELYLAKTNWTRYNVILASEHRGDLRWHCHKTLIDFGLRDGSVVQVRPREREDECSDSGASTASGTSSTTSRPASPAETPGPPSVACWAAAISTQPYGW